MAEQADGQLAVCDAQGRPAAQDEDRVKGVRLPRQGGRLADPRLTSKGTGGKGSTKIRKRRQHVCLPAAPKVSNLEKGF